MQLVEALRKSSNVPGSFVDVGFGYGKFANDILNLIEQKELDPRAFILVDRFNLEGGTVHPSKAIDFKHRLINVCKHPTTIVRGPVERFLAEALNNTSPAVAHVDIPVLEPYKLSLELCYDSLPYGGFLFTKYNTPVYHAFEQLAKRTGNLILFADQQKYSYIIKDRISTAAASPAKRTQSVLT